MNGINACYEVDLPVFPKDIRSVFLALSLSQLLSLLSHFSLKHDSELMTAT